MSRLGNHSNFAPHLAHFFFVHRVLAAVQRVEVAVQHTLKAIRVLEYSYIPCAKYSRYLAVAVANLAAILDSRN